VQHRLVGLCHQLSNEHATGLALWKQSCFDTSFTVSGVCKNMHVCHMSFKSFGCFCKNLHRSFRGAMLGVWHCAHHADLDRE
jgi:hypothetical protein